MVFAISFSPYAEAQRRQRPDSMIHTESDVVKARQTETVRCTYAKDGNTFVGTAWQVGLAGKMKIGTLVMTLNKGHYNLKFTSAQVTVRDANPIHKGPNPWRKEKLGNDFIQEGKYETFKKRGQIYLRLYDGDTNQYISDIPLEDKDAKNFTMFEDDWLFEFYLQ